MLLCYPAVSANMLRPVCSQRDQFHHFHHKSSVISKDLLDKKKDIATFSDWLIYDWKEIEKWVLTCNQSVKYPIQNPVERTMKMIGMCTDISREWFIYFV